MHYYIPPPRDTTQKARQLPLRNQRLRHPREHSSTASSVRAPPPHNQRTNSSAGLHSTAQHSTVTPAQRPTCPCPSTAYRSSDWSSATSVHTMTMPADAVGATATGCSSAMSRAWSVLPIAPPPPAPLPPPAEKGGCEGAQSTWPERRNGSRARLLFRNRLPRPLKPPSLETVDVVRKTCRVGVTCCRRKGREYTVLGRSERRFTNITVYTNARLWGPRAKGSLPTGDAAGTQEFTAWTICSPLLNHKRPGFPTTASFSAPNYAEFHASSSSSSSSRRSGAAVAAMAM